jgi:hypothetical protein
MLLTIWPLLIAEIFSGQEKPTRDKEISTQEKKEKRKGEKKSIGLDRACLS